MPKCPVPSNLSHRRHVLPAWFMLRGRVCPTGSSHRPESRDASACPAAIASAAADWMVMDRFRTWPGESGPELEGGLCCRHSRSGSSWSRRRGRLSRYLRRSRERSLTQVGGTNELVTQIYDV